MTLNTEANSEMYLKGMTQKKTNWRIENMLSITRSRLLKCHNLFVLIVEFAISFTVRFWDEESTKCMVISTDPLWTS